MIKCGWCGADTYQIYTLKDGKSLCPICANKHYDVITDKMTRHLQDIHNSLKKRADSLRRLKQRMCKHENIVDTGYGQDFSVKGWNSIWKCKDCGKELIKRIRADKKP